jgi:colanic acid biosynthesis glycosyl transferase WcaI
MKPALVRTARDLPNIHFLPLQPADRLGELLAMADIHVLPQNLGAADLVLPSKLSGMLASGKPVIAACRSLTELASVVSKCGIVVQPENAEDLAKAVSNLAEDPRARARLGRRARAYAEAHFEREVVLMRTFGELAGDIAAVADVDDAIA